MLKYTYYCYVSYTSPCTVCSSSFLTLLPVSFCKNSNEECVARHHVHESWFRFSLPLSRCRDTILKCVRFETQYKLSYAFSIHSVFSIYYATMFCLFCHFVPNKFEFIGFHYGYIYNLLSVSIARANVLHIWYQGHRVMTTIYNGLAFRFSMSIQNTLCHTHNRIILRRTHICRRHQQTVIVLIVI